MHFKVRLNVKGGTQDIYYGFSGPLVEFFVNNCISNLLPNSRKYVFFTAVFYYDK